MRHLLFREDILTWLEQYIFSEKVSLSLFVEKKVFPL